MNSSISYFIFRLARPHIDVFVCLYAQTKSYFPRFYQLPRLRGGSLQDGFPTLSNCCLHLSHFPPTPLTYATFYYFYTTVLSQAQTSHSDQARRLQKLACAIIGSQLFSFQELQRNPGVSSCVYAYFTRGHTPTLSICCNTPSKVWVPHQDG